MVYNLDTKTKNEQCVYLSKPLWNLANWDNTFMNWCSYVLWLGFSKTPCV